MLPKIINFESNPAILLKEELSDTYGQYAIGGEILRLFFFSPLVAKTEKWIKEDLAMRLESFILSFNSENQIRLDILKEIPFTILEGKLTGRPIKIQQNQESDRVFITYGFYDNNKEYTNFNIKLAIDNYILFKRY